MTDEEFAALKQSIEERMKLKEKPDLELAHMCCDWVNEAIRRELLALMGAGLTQKTAFTAPAYVDPKLSFAQNLSIGENQYKCDCCRGIFNKGWSDEEALQEAANNFPFMKQEDAGILCDDCYKQIMAWEAKEGRGDQLHS